MIFCLAKFYTHKLDRLEIHGSTPDLLVSYLSYRKQISVSKSETSVSSALKSGVPQGSALGPLMFILYVNDVFQITLPRCTIAFANDTVIVFRGTDLKSLYARINECMKRLNKWLRCNDRLRYLCSSRRGSLAYQVSAKSVRDKSWTFLVRKATNDNQLLRCSHIEPHVPESSVFRKWVFQKTY